MQALFKTKIYAILIIIGLFIFSTLIINTSVFDEKLDPRVVSILQSPSTPASIDNNAYFALMGISAAANRNINQTGGQLVERYQQNRSHGNDNLSREEYQKILGVKPNIDKQWQERYDNCSARTEYGCLNKVSKQLLSTPIKGSRLSLMLKRYERIMQMTTYQHSIKTTQGTPMPRYSILLNLSQLKLAQLYNSATNSEFLSQIAIELGFWKMHLTDGTTIIDKMIAVAGIRNNLNYLSEFMQANEVLEQEKAIISSLLIPLTQTQLDISEGFISESYTMFDKVASMNSSLFDPKFILFQPHATMNTFYQHFTQPMVKLNEMSTKEFIQHRYSENNKLRRKQKASLLSFSPSSLYNYNGKTIISTNYCLGCQDYIARVHDLNNMIHLLKLQLSLKTNNNSTIEQAVAIFINPYTERPYDFDKDGNWLQFDCLDPSSICRIKI